MNIIGHKWVFLGIAVVLVAASFAAIGYYGLREGIDFSGGTLWTLKADESVGTADIKRVLAEDLKIEDPRISQDVQTQSFLVSFKEVGESDHQTYLAALRGRLPSVEELSFQSIGPSVGDELRRKSISAIVLVLIGISLYIAYAFRRVYKPVASWKYGIITLITLFHDVIIPAGLIAALGYYHRAEIDSNFVVALLVVMGFSVHDTIVVFDRIRENLSLDRGRNEFGKVVNDSINQTMARSINTSLTLILVLLALYFAGPLALRYFVLTLLVGVVMGIYSSIFVASPLLEVWHRTTSSGRK